MIGLTLSQWYKDIANAIRSVNGSSDTYKPSEMADAIRNSAPPKYLYEMKDDMVAYFTGSWGQRLKYEDNILKYYFTNFAL